MEVCIDARLVGQLERICKQHSATLFQLLVSAWGRPASLSQPAGIILGTPLSGRWDPAAANLVGLVINVAPLRLQFAGDPTFEQLLAQVRTRLLDGLDDEDIPLDAVLEELRLPAGQEFMRALIVFQEPLRLGDGGNQTFEFTRVRFKSI